MWALAVGAQLVSSPEDHCHRRLATIQESFQMSSSSGFNIHCRNLLTVNLTPQRMEWKCAHRVIEFNSAPTGCLANSSLLIATMPLTLEFLTLNYLFPVLQRTITNRILFFWPLPFLVLPLIDLKWKLILENVHNATTINKWHLSMTTIVAIETQVMLDAPQ